MFLYSLIVFKDIIYGLSVYIFFQGVVPEIECDQLGHNYKDIQILSGHADLVDVILKIDERRYFYLLIEGKAVWRSVFLTVQHCILNADSTKTPSSGVTFYPFFAG